MLHAGLDLSRRKVDVCLLSDDGEHLDQLVVPPDADSLRTLAKQAAASSSLTIGESPSGSSPGLLTSDTSPQRSESNLRRPR